MENYLGCKKRREKMKKKENKKMKKKEKQNKQKKRTTCLYISDNCPFPEIYFA